jgi:hypothetical protein
LHRRPAGQHYDLRALLCPKGNLQLAPFMQAHAWLRRRGHEIKGRGR